MAAQVADPEELKTVTFATPPIEERRKEKKERPCCLTCKKEEAVCKAVINMDADARREQQFREQLLKWHERNKRVLITRAYYFETVSEILSILLATSKTPLQHYTV